MAENKCCFGKYNECSDWQINQIVQHFWQKKNLVSDFMRKVLLLKHNVIHSQYPEIGLFCLWYLIVSLQRIFNYIIYSTSYRLFCYQCKMMYIVLSCILSINTIIFFLRQVNWCLWHLSVVLLWFVNTYFLQTGWKASCSYLHVPATLSFSFLSEKDTLLCITLLSLS